MDRFFGSEKKHAWLKACRPNIYAKLNSESPAATQMIDKMACAAAEKAMQK